jgi:hypothetical protein
MKNTLQVAMGVLLAGIMAVGGFLFLAYIAYVCQHGGALNL